MQISLSINSDTGGELSTNSISVKSFLISAVRLPENAEINMNTSDSRIQVKTG